MKESEVLEPQKSENDTFLPEKFDIIENQTKKESPWADWQNKIACAFFGMGWMAIQFVFSQIPVIIHTAPESWSLPSYITLIMSFGNIVSLINYFNKRRLLLNFTPIIIGIYIVFIVSLIGLALTYHIVIPINGHPRSVFLFFFIFLLSCAGCMYNVLSLPFISLHKKEYLVPFFIGQGLESSLPGLLGLIQVMISHGSNPDSTEMVFSSKYFFLIGAFCVFLSTLSFFHLSKQAKLQAPKDESESEKEIQSNPQRSYIIMLLVIRAVFSFFDYGLLPGLQSFSCLPYLRGKLVYKIIMNTNQFLGGIVVYLISFTNLRSTKRLLVISAIQLCINSYETTTAFMSPHPPMAKTMRGSIHIVLVWLSGYCLSYYTKVSMPAIIREKSPKHLYYYGGAILVGSAIGSFLSFFVANFTSLLKSKSI